jgi:argininosuccinate lyase
MRAEHEAFGDDVSEVFDWARSADARDTAGGTSRRAIEAQLEDAAQRMVRDT